MQKTAIQKLRDNVIDGKADAKKTLDRAIKDKDWAKVSESGIAIQLANALLNYIDEESLPTERQQIEEAYLEGYSHGQNAYPKTPSDYYTSTFQTPTDATPNK